MGARDDNVHDLVGVGFGPAGIALAAAIHDAEELAADDAPALDVLFFERAPDSSWQPGMLLMDTHIQHHFLRDFATPRNPRSRLTFANYLKETGRLFAFGNYGPRVSRIEWSDYVEWVAREARRPVRYRHQVTAVRPVVDDGGVSLLTVEARNVETGAVSEHLARNVVVSTGHRPFTPPCFEGLLGPRVFHAHSFVGRIAELDPSAPLSFAVIGSGQNAAEILVHLVGHFPHATVHSINRNSGFRIFDFGHFSQQAYWPEETDYVFELPKDVRRQHFEDIRYTNYSAIDIDVSAALYRFIYQNSVLGREPLKIVKRVDVTGAVRRGDGYRLSLEHRHTGERGELDADVVILCTGLTESRSPDVLAPIEAYLEHDDDGDLLVSRRYRVATKPNFLPRVYLSGITEWRHGISNATSFSMMALKAAELLEDLRADDLDARPGPAEEEARRMQAEFDDPVEQLAGAPSLDMAGG